MKDLAQKSQLPNNSNERISQKFAYAKCLADAKFGQCEFFPEPKVALAKDSVP